ncbi:hypothetical protein BRE01_32920 [Brevibacillus reuszeri]|uniref:Uncharacterized protein n=1 Tax=Brevibacillus reuszeri TaxID=54915 RepID=A0ABQ0TP63_9BACL|nr:hypothetical protein BRE01_32920 [Brevibacillus reuszeri]
MFSEVFKKGKILEVRAVVVGGKSRKRVRFLEHLLDDSLDGSGKNVKPRPKWSVPGFFSEVDA